MLLIGCPSSIMSSAATSSPASSNKIGDSIIAIAAINGSTTPQKPGSFEMPKQSLRGLNKPKCIKCGNVARSRCPFQSCKSCCAKAENPCYIHVLKQSSTLPDKPPPSTPSVEPPVNDVPSNGASWRLNALKQQSVHLANTLRTKKPLTRKDALSINSWRFTKLKEYIQGNIDAENEAFERYTTKVSLLKETFSMAEGIFSDTHSASETSSSEDKKQKLVSDIKIKLKANVERADSYRKRMRDLIDQKLTGLQEKEHATSDDLDDDDESDNCRELKKLCKAVKWRSDRNLAVGDLIEKLSRARNEDDLRSCLDLKLQLSKQIVCVTVTPSDTGACSDLISKPSIPEKEPENGTTDLSLYSMPKVWKAVHVDHDALSSVNMEFSSSNQIAEL